MRQVIIQRVIACLVLLAAVFSARAQIPEISRVAVDASAPDGARVMTLEVGIVQDGTVSLEPSASLRAGTWAGRQDGVQAAAPGTVLALPHTDGSNAIIYRAWFTPNMVSAGTNLSGAYEITVWATSTVAHVLQALGRELDFPPYLADVGQMADPVEPGMYSGVNVEALLSNLHVRAWLPPPMNDDQAYAAVHFPPNEGLKPGIATNFPGDVGTNTMEDGWGGDPAKPNPVTISPPLPAPGSLDKPFNPDIAPDNLSEPTDAVAIPAGYHLRLHVWTDPSSATLLGAQQLAGGALWADDPPAPAEDAFVWLARSPHLQGTNHNIYYLNARSNPWKTEALDDTGEFPQSVCCMGETRLRIPVPIPEGGAASNLAVELYRYVDAGPMGRLAITNFIAHSNRFALLLGLRGSDLTNAMARARAPRAWQGALADPQIKTLHRSGDIGRKVNLVVIGDGFADTPADQAVFTNHVYRNVIRGLFTHDINLEILNAFNIYQIQTYSADSNVTQLNATGGVVVARNTALDWRYSGAWKRCWMEPGPHTAERTDAILDALCPQADMVITILNTNRGGGCARGESFAGTILTGWATLAHEFGHMFGDLGDEYRCKLGDDDCEAYTGKELQTANLTTNSGNRAQLKWQVWVPPHRPLPTTAAQVADPHQDVGLFEAATLGNQKYWKGIFRPTRDSRMSDDWPLFNPVGYTQVRENARRCQGASFQSCAVGDYDGDGNADVAFLDDRQLGLFVCTNRPHEPKDPVTQKSLRPPSATLLAVWYHTGSLLATNPASRWDFRAGDQLFPGDFNGDGLSDLYVVNLTNFTVPYLGMLRSDGQSFTPVCRYRLKLPGWDDMKKHDQFAVLDFDGDGLDDLLVYNGVDWDVPYLALLRSSGSNLEYQVIYPQYLPGIDSMGDELGKHERLHVGRFQNNGRESVLLHNREDFAYGRFIVLGSSGVGLTPLCNVFGQAHYPYWILHKNDELYVLDFTGDGRDDIALFNGRNYLHVYMGFLYNDGTGTIMPGTRYDTSMWQVDLPGWQLARRDRFWPSDVNGDGLEDLVAFNGENWDAEYLGILRSDGSYFWGSWQRDFVAGWNLGNHDNFVPAEFRGGPGWTDLFVYNKDWCGILRSYRYQFGLEALYYKWIHTHRYHAEGWW